jgi:diguanylate cyclase (GGDEF)-like protein/PAS domain S-box-containing protein
VRLSHGRPNTNIAETISQMTTPDLAIRRDPAPIVVRSWRETLSQAPTVDGSAAAIIGLIVLVGWALDLDPLKSILPGVSTMKANTALCFVLMGTGVVLLFRSTESSRNKWVARVLIGVAGSIALATGAQYITGVNLGIDQLVFADPAGAIGTIVPGRMSPLTTVGFIMLAVAALAAPTFRRTVIVLAGVVLAMALLFIFESVFGAAAPTFLTGYTQVALITAIAMGTLSFGVIGLLGPADPFIVLTSRSPTMGLLRRLLAVSVLIPVVMAWLRLEGERLNLYDTSFGTSLMLVGILALGVIAILRSAEWVNELEAKREASELERDRFFDLSLDMLSVVDSEGNYRRVNRAWETVLGYPVAELVGRSFLDLVHPDDLEKTVTESKRLYEDGEVSVGFQNRMRHRDGGYRWLEWMSHTPPDLSVAYGVARDITDRKRDEDRRAMRQRVLETRNETLSERTIRDALTGLHNRRFFDAEVVRLEGHWARMPVGDRPPVSVIIFDLDQFGEVNNQYGHQAGDTVLRVFGALLTKRFREHDLVARYGGEEFVAVLEGAASADALRIAEDIRASFERESIDIGSGTPIRVTVSAGCAQLGEDGSTSAGLSQADVWLSQAKRAGRNQVVGL